MRKYQVIIVGAGPAGLRCAKILAENKQDVLILEKNQNIERKICTGFWIISNETKHVGLPDKIFEKRFKKVIVSIPKRKIEVKWKTPFAATLNRKKLGEWMLKETSGAGVDIVFDSPVSKIGKNYVIIRGKKIYFDYLVGADGSSSIVRRSLGLLQPCGIGMQYWIDENLENVEIHYDAERFGPWYSWIAPHKRATSIGTGTNPRVISPEKMRKNLDAWCKERGIDVSSSRFETAPLSYDYKGYRFGNKFLIGDAAGLISSLTGEGIYFAMLSGEEIAKLIIDKNHMPVMINRILEIKRKQELITSSFLLSKSLEKIEYNLLLHLLKHEYFVRKAINLMV